MYWTYNDAQSRPCSLHLHDNKNADDDDDEIGYNERSFFFMVEGFKLFPLNENWYYYNGNDKIRFF